MAFDGGAAAAGGGAPGRNVVISLVHKGALVPGAIARAFRKVTGGEAWAVVDVCNKEGARFTSTGHEFDGHVIDIDNPRILAVAALQKLTVGGYTAEDVRGLILEVNLNSNHKFSQLGRALVELKASFPNIHRVIGISGDLTEGLSGTKVSEIYGEHNTIVGPPVRIPAENVLFCFPVDGPQYVRFFMDGLGAHLADPEAGQYHPYLLSDVPKLQQLYLELQEKKKAQAARNAATESKGEAASATSGLEGRGELIRHSSSMPEPTTGTATRADDVSVSIGGERDRDSGGGSGGADGGSRRAQRPLAALIPGGSSSGGASDESHSPGSGRVVATRTGGMALRGGRNTASPANSSHIGAKAEEKYGAADAADAEALEDAGAVGDAAAAVAVGGDARGGDGAIRGEGVAPRPATTWQDCLRQCCCPGEGVAVTR